MKSGSLIQEVFESEEEVVSEEGIIKEDTRRRINKSIKNAPFRYICRIKVVVPGGQIAGSGTLIGPRTVLTAGHVVWDKANEKKWDVSQITVIPAMNEKVTPFGVFKVSDVVLSKPGFTSADFVTNKDYAIIHLTSSAANTAGYWGKKWKLDPIGTSILQKSLPLPAGTQKVNLSGYPGDKGRNTPQWATYQYWSYNYTKQMEHSQTILTYLNDMYPGQSGCPVWVTRSADHGGRNLVAINVGYRIDQSRNIGVFINDEVRKFIAANTI